MLKQGKQIKTISKQIYQHALHMNEEYFQDIGKSHYLPVDVAFTFACASKY